MDILDFKAKAFDFAADYTKLLITIATAVITFTITFIHEIFQDNFKSYRGFLITGWIFLFLSVFFGIWRLMALTGSLNRGQIPGSPPSSLVAEPSLSTFNIRIPGLFQIGFFLVGIVLAGIFSYCRISNKEADNGSTNALVSKETIISKDTVIRIDTFYLKK